MVLGPNASSPTSRHPGFFLFGLYIYQSYTYVYVCVYIFIFFITCVSKDSPRLVPWARAVSQSLTHQIITRPNGPGGGSKGIQYHGVSNLQLTLPKVILQPVLPLGYPPKGFMYVCISGIPFLQWLSINSQGLMCCS
jgi:hypothetical protein